MSKSKKVAAAKSEPLPAKVDAKVKVASAQATSVPAAKKVIAKVDAARHATPATKLEWLVTSNPKRPGSASQKRAELYWGAPTVEEYLKRGGERVDLAWDADHGFLALKA